MPEHALPAHYGIDDPRFPPGFFGQTVYPFRDLMESGVPGRVKSHPPAL
jgi:hypothetical protein